MSKLVARLIHFAFIAGLLAAAVLSLGKLQRSAEAQALLINTDLPERQLVIQRAGETIAGFTVEIADTPDTQRIGLMGRTQLAADRGMLFIWETPILASMWMKNTLIPLDFVFVRADGTIAWIVHNVQPCPPEGACPGYGSPVPVTMVLEVAGGRAAELGLRIGDKLVVREPMP